MRKNSHFIGQQNISQNPSEVSEGLNELCDRSRMAENEAP